MTPNQSKSSPVAYAVFADNGNIRVWSTTPIEWATERGLTVTPLYASADAINAELLEALKKARDFADSVHDGEYGWNECTRDELVEQIDALIKRATA